MSVEVSTEVEVEVKAEVKVEVKLEVKMGVKVEVKVEVIEAEGKTSTNGASIRNNRSHGTSVSIYRRMYGGTANLVTSDVSLKISR
jgi:hypothetical protein